MNGLVSLVDEEDVLKIVSTQRKTLRKYEEMNELIRRFNDVAEKTFQDAHLRFSSHVKLLSSLKRDLDNIFRRIRLLKEKLHIMYPESFEATADAIRSLIQSYCIDEDNDQEPQNVSDFISEKVLSDTIKETGREESASNQVESKESDEMVGETFVSHSDGTSVGACVSVSDHFDTSIVEVSLGSEVQSRSDFMAINNQSTDAVDASIEEPLKGASITSNKLESPIDIKRLGDSYVEDADTGSD